MAAQVDDVGATTRTAYEEVLQREKIRTSFGPVATCLSRVLSLSIAVLLALSSPIYTKENLTANRPGDGPSTPLMETPKFPPPQDEGEKQILAKLVEIQDKLLLRKLDRTTYVRSQDVISLYDETTHQVKLLNETRRGKSVEENRGALLTTRMVRTL